MCGGKGETMHHKTVTVPVPAGNFILYLPNSINCAEKRLTVGSAVCSAKQVLPYYAGIEDGQTVRMPVGSKEIFITFQV